MILQSVNYFENKGKPNYWEIKDIFLTRQNILVGLNATGKTRTLTVITSFALLLSSKRKIKQGNWFLTFKDNGNQYSYDLQIDKGIIETEIIKRDGNVLLERHGNEGKLFSVKENSMHEFNPPSDELTLNIRRDTAHYPFLEMFIDWAKNLRGYIFSGVNNAQITIPNSTEAYLDTLTTIPYILKDADFGTYNIANLIADMNEIGYPIEEIYSKAEVNMNNIFTVVLKEADLECETEQRAISNGMFRALCSIIIIEYFGNTKKTGTIIIDDIGEGLDFERSTKLTKLLFEKTKDSDLQLIFSSNDRFLINSVEMNQINYLERTGHVVKALNYHNSKDDFDKFQILGLNNFDFINPKLAHVKD